MAHLSAKGPALVGLVLVSHGAMAAGMLEAAQMIVGEQDAVEAVTLLETDNIETLMERGHVLVAPSVTAGDGDEEGIPVTIMEAMATGLPVLATEHGGIPELVGDGASGYLVPERDVEALAQRIGRLAAAPKGWAALGRAGRDAVERGFDARTLNDRLVRLYEKVASRTR